MTHLALYREFRPKTFDEVVGQDHIIKILTHQIEHNTISHAYLFCGTRGTGKTSCAKIFAKSVNCLNPKNGSACGECENCKKIDSNGNLDIIEIDAASNNRVDEIRDLREKVGYLPSVGKYKVYIIDEVHMLTDSAFNALLKTLEEPPQHIIFILATTEPDKLPATILSRCMRFDFKLVSVPALTDHLKNIFDKLNIKYEMPALTQIAVAGNGSVRDTLSVAEMCRAYGEDNITTKSVQECLGIVEAETVRDIVLAVAKRDGGQVLTIINNLYTQGKNLSSLMSNIADFLRNVLMIKFSNNLDLQETAEMLESYKQVANICDENFLIDALRRLSDGIAQIKFTTNTKIFIETLLLSLLYNDNLEIQLLKNKVQSLEQMLNGKIDTNSIVVKKQSQDSGLLQPNAKPIKTETSQSLQNQTKVDETDAKVVFGKFIGAVRESGEMLLLAVLGDIKSVEIKNNKFEFNCETKDCIEVLNEHKNFITQFLQKNGLDGFVINQYVDEQKQKAQKLVDMFDGKIEIAE